MGLEALPDWHLYVVQRPVLVLAPTARCVLYYKTVLPKGACRPLLDTPCGWRGFGIDPHHASATSARCSDSQGRRSCSPDTPMTKGDFRSPLEPIGQGARFLSPLASPVDQPCCADWLSVIPGLWPGISSREAALYVVECLLCSRPLRGGTMRVRRNACSVSEHRVQFEDGLAVQVLNGRDMRFHRCLLGWETALCGLCEDRDRHRTRYVRHPNRAATSVEELDGCPVCGVSRACCQNRHQRPCGASSRRRRWPAINELRAIVDLLDQQPQWKCPC